jgi:hypothetical protein
MTKAEKKPDTVRVWHPGYQAEAHPRREDLAAWIEQGWQEQPAAKETEK